MRGLPGGEVLIGAQKGLFLFDPTSGRVVPAGEAPAGSVLDMLGLSGGAVLIGAQNGLFRFDPTSGHVGLAGEAAMGFVFSLLALPGGAVLIGAQNGWFRFDPASARVVPAGETGGVFVLHDLPGGGVLIGAQSGWFRFDPASGRVVAAGEATTTDETVYRLPDRGFMVLLQRQAFAMHDLVGGAVLIGSSSGWFRFDPASGRVASAGKAKTIPFEGRDPEIGGANGSVRFFEFPVPNVPQQVPQQEQMRFVMHDLPGGTVLIGAENGLFMAPGAPLAEAAVKAITDLRQVAVNPNSVEVRLSFSHPCAPESGDLGVTLVSAVDGTEGAREPVHRLSDQSALANTAILAAPIQFDRPGKWSLQLHQGSTPIGKPIRFSVTERPLLEVLEATWEASWQIALSVLVGLYVLAFTVLLLLTRRYTTALRLLFDDSAWAKLLTWPVFFLRHLPVVQRWFLETWFQEVRRNTQTDVRFLDPPVSSTSGPSSEGIALLQRLHDRPRLWLHGRSGMGKSSVFAAWQRAFFSTDEAPSLSAAVRRYGFILIALPVRHYAALAPPETNRPESWVLEAVRRQLEEFGFPAHNRGLIEAMLKAGGIALTLDGTNEADRDTALSAFARQFHQVPLLVTSQAAGDEGWEIWHLPEDVSELRDSLLVLWLGREIGRLLSHRIAAEGLSQTISSGYDLRLIADLAGADAEHTPLPSDRVELYRAMLAQVLGPNGQPIRLEGLKRLAWTMVIERRREIVSDDEKLLGSGILHALAKEGVRIVRSVAAVHEFRHDQMRAFLAASWLYEEMPSLSELETAATDAGAFALNRRDQDELWHFIAALVSDDDLKTLWHFADEEPEPRAILLACLQTEADKRDVTLVRSARRRMSKKAIEALREH
jgi:hypothetical protein